MQEKTNNVILVTGGTGLVGTHLLYDLARLGKQVRVLKRTGSNIANVKKVFSYYTANSEELIKYIEWVDADLLDVYSIVEAMEGITEVYHCAAIVSFDPKKQKEMMKINVEGTANIVNACLQKGIKKICYVSSIATIGRGKNNEPSTEKTFWKSSPENSAYSISKYGAEREVWRASEEGLDVVIVNPGLIIGGGNWQQSSSNMFYKAYEGIKFYTDGATGFIDVRDVSALMIRLMESTVSNEQFLLVGENATYKHFFDLVHQRFGKKKPAIKAGKMMSGIAWRADKLRYLITGATPLITKETARSAHNKNCFSNDKIINLFPDYKFIPLEKSIEDTCNFFLKDIIANQK